MSMTDDTYLLAKGRASSSCQHVLVTIWSDVADAGFANSVVKKYTHVRLAEGTIEPPCVQTQCSSLSNILSSCQKFGQGHTPEQKSQVRGSLLLCPGEGCRKCTGIHSPCRTGMLHHSQRAQFRIWAVFVCTGILTSDIQEALPAHDV